MGIEEQIKEKGRAYVIESLKTKIRFYQKRRVTIEETIRIAQDRLVEIRKGIEELDNDLKQAEESECTSK
jgi:prefoldin subunit 5